MLCMCGDLDVWIMFSILFTSDRLAIEKDGICAGSGNKKKEWRWELLKKILKTKLFKHQQILWTCFFLARKKARSLMLHAQAHTKGMRFENWIVHFPPFQMCLDASRYFLLTKKKNGYCEHTKWYFPIFHILSQFVSVKWMFTNGI